MQEKDTAQYDAGYKEELSKKTEFLHFLKKYVKASWAGGVQEEDVELCDKEFVLEDFKKRAADLVYKIRLLTYLFSLMLKVFLEEDEKVRGRMEYRFPAVVPVLFYNGEHPWSALKNFAQYQSGHSLFGGHLVDFEYYLVDLTQVSNEYILSSNTLIDNILALDKNKRNTPQLSTILELLQERLKELTEDDQVSFGRWMEYVLLAVVDKGSEDKVRLLIEKLRGDAHSMIHGLQQVILNEHAAGFDEGVEAGIEKGIEVLIRDNQEEGISKERILEKLQVRFELTKEKAEGYIGKYWKK